MIVVAAKTKPQIVQHLAGYVRTIEGVGDPFGSHAATRAIEFPQANHAVIRVVDDERAEAFHVFGDVVEALPSLFVRFREAGHILGAAMVATFLVASRFMTRGEEKP